METVIKEEIASLRTDANNLFIFLMAVLTGATTVMYQVLIGAIKQPLFLLIGLIGIFIVFITYKKLVQTKNKIDDKITELRKLAYKKERKRWNT